MGISQQGCRDTLTRSGLIRVTETISGLSLDQFKEISLYPNPANETINLTLGDNKVSEVTLRSLKGKRSKAFSVSNRDRLAIPVNDLASGSYLIVVRFKGGKKAVERVVVGSY